jgi:serine/threonine protein kinase
VQLFEYREDENNFYFIEEYCSGGKLINKILKLSELSENLVAEVMR